MKQIKKSLSSMVHHKMEEVDHCMYELLKDSPEHI